MSRRVLVVDDDRKMRRAMSEVLEKAGHEVDIASDGRQALDRLHVRRYDLVLSDVRMPGMPGDALLQEVRRRAPSTAMVFVTAHGTVDHAVESLHLGLADYLRKPFERERLLQVVDKALRARPAGGDGELITEHASMHDLLERARRAAATDVTVLLQAESGTGKELLARFVHRESARAAAPFEALNCACVPRELLEGELFGHDRGAFTGAVKERRGVFEIAAGGTLLLDEIGELEPSLQAKLLRVLQEREFRRIGSERTVAADVRIIASTNRDLRQEVVARRFREDLFYRLNVMPLSIPPLRERLADVPLLARHFCTVYAERYGRAVPELTAAATRRLQEWRWPGNVRELENVVQRAVVQTPTDRIDADDLFFDPEPSTEATFAPRRLDDLEQSAIESALRHTRGNRTRASEILGITPRTLRNKLRTYSERDPDYPFTVGGD